jgi:hypothetical protein
VLSSSWGVGGRLQLRALSIASCTARECKASSDISQGAQGTACLAGSTFRSIKRFTFSSLTRHETPEKVGGSEMYLPMLEEHRFDETGLYLLV